LPADKVAQDIIKAIRKERINIIPGGEAKLLFFAATRLGGGIFPIMDMLVCDAMKKKQSSHSRKVEKSVGVCLGMEIDNLLLSWQNDEEFTGNITCWNVTPAKPTDYSPFQPAFQSSCSIT